MPTHPDDVMRAAGLMIQGATASIVVAKCGHCDNFHLGVQVGRGQLMVIANFPDEEMARLMMMAMNNIAAGHSVVLHGALTDDLPFSTAVH